MSTPITICLIETVGLSPYPFAYDNASRRDGKILAIEY